MGDDRMQVITVGAGAVGGYFSNLIARCGHNLTVLARGEKLDAVRERGIRIVGGPDEGHAHVDAVDELDEGTHADLLIVATKTYDTAAACKAAEPAVSEDTVVLPLQNGVNRAERFRELLPTCTVLGGTVFMESVAAAPGEVRYLSGPRRIVMGGYDDESQAQARRIGLALQRCGINVTIADDIEQELWKKFVLVCAGNALTSLTRSTLGELLDDADGRQMVGDVMREAVRIGAAQGVALDEEYVPTGLEYLEGMGAKARSSMLADVEAGRATEVDALNGYVVDQAADLGIDASLNRVITTALRLHNKRVTENR